MEPIQYKEWIDAISVFLQGNYYLIVPITSSLILILVFLIYKKVKKIHKAGIYVANEVLKEKTKGEELFGKEEFD